MGKNEKDDRKHGRRGFLAALGAAAAQLVTDGKESLTSPARDTQTAEPQKASEESARISDQDLVENHDSLKKKWGTNPIENDPADKKPQIASSKEPGQLKGQISFKGYWPLELYQEKKRGQKKGPAPFHLRYDATIQPQAGFREEEAVREAAIELLKKKLTDLKLDVIRVEIENTRYHDSSEKSDITLCARVDGNPKDVIPKAEQALRELKQDFPEIPSPTVAPDDLPYPPSSDRSPER